MKRLVYTLLLTFVAPYLFGAQSLEEQFLEKVPQQMTLWTEKNLAPDATEETLVDFAKAFAISLNKADTSMSVPYILFDLYLKTATVFARPAGVANPVFAAGSSADEAFKKFTQFSKVAMHPKHQLFMSRVLRNSVDAFNPTMLASIGIEDLTYSTFILIKTPDNITVYVIHNLDDNPITTKCEDSWFVHANEAQNKDRRKTGPARLSSSRAAPVGSWADPFTPPARAALRAPVIFLQDGPASPVRPTPPQRRLTDLTDLILPPPAMSLGRGTNSPQVKSPDTFKGILPGVPDLDD